MAAMLGWKLTEAQRQRTIARLEVRRDRFLRSAPKRYLLQLLWTPLMLVVIAVFCFAYLHQVVAHLGLTLNHFVYLAMLGLALAVFGRAAWLLWRVPPPANGDLWAISDRCQYDSDDHDPRVLQAKIDALRAQPVHEG
jgi:hypothetical protein